MTTSNSARRWGTSLAIVALGCTFTPLASAQGNQPSAADLESARELYKDAKALRDKGDLRGALERFKAAHAYGQTPVTGLELGKTHMTVGELVEAREVLLSVGRMKVQSDETEKSAAARAEAAELAEQIRPRIPTLTVRLTGVPQDAQAQVTVDGIAVPVVGLVSVRKANPGPHAVVAKVGAREEKRTIDLKEGESKDESISLEGAAVTAEDNGSKTSSGRVISPVTWIGAGIAVAGIGVGTVAGVVALGKASSVKDQCRGLDCPTAAQEDVDSGRTAATFSTIGFAVGGAGLALAAVGFFVLSKPAKSAEAPRVQVIASPAWVGVGGRF